MHQTILYGDLDFDDTKYRGSTFHHFAGVGVDLHSRPTLKPLLGQLEDSILSVVFGMRNTAA